MTASLSANDHAAMRSAQARAECITCHRAIDNVTRRATHEPVLPDDDFCRWCSRAVSAQANELGEALSRPASHDVYNQESAVSVSGNGKRRKPYAHKPVRAA